MALRLLGRIAGLDGDRSAAEERLRAALSAFTLLEDDAAVARILSELADLYVADGDFTTATDLRRQAAERHPGDTEVLTGLGYVQWLGGSPADGEVTFERVLSRDHGAVRALTGQGQIRADLGDYREALADLDEALGLGLDRDDEIDVRSARALALAGLGRLDEAEAEIDAALAMDPDRPRSRVRRGRIAELAGRAAQARSDLEQVLRRGSGPAPVEVRTARRILERLSAQG